MGLDLSEESQDEHESKEKEFYGHKEFKEAWNDSKYDPTKPEIEIDIPYSSDAESEAATTSTKPAKHERSHKSALSLPRKGVPKKRLTERKVNFDLQPKISVFKDESPDENDVKTLKKREREVSAPQPKKATKKKKRTAKFTESSSESSSNESISSNELVRLEQEFARQIVRKKRKKCKIEKPASSPRQQFSEDEHELAPKQRSPENSAQNMAESENESCVNSEDENVGTSKSPEQTQSENPTTSLNERFFIRTLGHKFKPIIVNDGLVQLCHPQRVQVHPYSFLKIDLRLEICIPKGYCAQIMPNGNLSKRGIQLAVNLLTDRTSSLFLVYTNSSPFAQTFRGGECAAKLVFLKLASIPTVICGMNLESATAANELEFF